MQLLTIQHILSLLLFLVQLGQLFRFEEASPVGAVLKVGVVLAESDGRRGQGSSAAVVVARAGGNGGVGSGERGWLRMGGGGRLGQGRGGVDVGGARGAGHAHGLSGAVTVMTRRSKKKGRREMFITN